MDPLWSAPGAAQGNCTRKLDALLGPPNALLGLVHDSAPLLFAQEEEPVHAVANRERGKRNVCVRALLTSVFCGVRIRQIKLVSCWAMAAVVVRPAAQSA